MKNFCRLCVASDMPSLLISKLILNMTFLENLRLSSKNDSITDKFFMDINGNLRCDDALTFAFTFRSRMPPGGVRYITGNLTEFKAQHKDTVFYPLIFNQ